MEQVLLVEDEILIAEMIKDALEDRGLRVHSAHTGRGAYDLLAGEGRSFAVLIADIHLGAGADGFEVAPPQDAWGRGLADDAQALLSRGAGRARRRDVGALSPLEHDAIRRNRLIVESCSRLKSLSAL
jgi:CheY-like chemotaxis protein